MDNWRAEMVCWRRDIASGIDFLYSPLRRDCYAIYPWREPKDLLANTIHQVRDFLRAHQPVTAGR